MNTREFWWASIEGRAPQVVEVAESHGIRFTFATGTDIDLNEDKVRLIERVLPAGAPRRSSRSWRRRQWSGATPASATGLTSSRSSRRPPASYSPR